MRYVIGLGANLEPRAENISRAVDLIGVQVGTVVRLSTLRETDPVVLPGESVDQHPRYLNAALVCSSRLNPEQVLHELLSIEQKLGRVRGVTERRWQPRLIDLDLIAAEELIVQSPALTVPHAEMTRRAFVLEPLVEIWPEWRHPVTKMTSVQLLATLQGGF